MKKRKRLGKDAKVDPVELKRALDYAIVEKIVVPTWFERMCKDHGLDTSRLLVIRWLPTK